MQIILFSYAIFSGFRRFFRDFLSESEQKERNNNTSKKEKKTTTPDTPETQRPKRKKQSDTVRGRCKHDPVSPAARFRASELYHSIPETEAPAYAVRICTM